jgi:cysteine desulfurase
VTYLDHNATAPLRPEALEAATAALVLAGNASSVHGRGRAARAVIENARDAVAKLSGARAEDVTFTSGGTEANALALWGAVYGALDAEQRITRIFISAIEHSSVRINAETVAARMAGVRLAEIPVTPDGTVDTEALRVLLREGKGRALVAVMAANNETGVIQPLAEVARHARDSGALLMVDAVQAAGKTALAVDADYLTLSAHKLGGPQGSGAVVVRAGVPFAPLIAGGGHERGRRGGTENVPGIAGFGAAAIAALADDPARVAALRDGFETEMLRRWPDLVVFGVGSPRLCNTSNIGLPGVPAETAMMALDLDGVMVSSGAACSSGKVRPSHVLKAMRVSEELAASALRISFGWNSNGNDVGAILASLEKLSARARSRRAA